MFHDKATVSQHTTETARAATIPLRHTVLLRVAVIQAELLPPKRTDSRGVRTALQASRRVHKST